MRKAFIMTVLLAFCCLSGLNSHLTHAMEVKQKEITIEQAKKIALEKVKGEIVDVKEENDDGIVKYEIIIKGNDGKYEVEIDKATGKVLEVEKEGPGSDDESGYDD